MTILNIPYAFTIRHMATGSDYSGIIFKPNQEAATITAIQTIRAKIMLRKKDKAPQVRCVEIRRANATEIEQHFYNMVEAGVLSMDEAERRIDKHLEDLDGITQFECPHGNKTGDDCSCILHQIAKTCTDRASKLN